MGRSQSELKRNVLSNTNVKTIGKNSIGNVKPLGQETNIPVFELLRLKQFEFYIHAGDKRPRKLKLKNTFWTGSPLLLSSGQVRSLNHRTITETSMYKPIVEAHNTVEEWTENFPRDLKQQVRDASSPKPKFTF